jgi:hypothetical protein
MCVTTNGINMLYASKNLCNPANRKSIAGFTLHDVLYWITLENKAHLFLQLSQHPSGEVGAIIPNTAEAELMAKKDEHPDRGVVPFLLEGVKPRS